MSQDKHEQEFDNYLEGDSGLSTNYHLASSEQPLARLDDAILAASRRAVKSKPRYAFSPFASDWHVPLSLAAVLVLSVTVIVTLQKESDDIYLKTPTEFRPQTVSESAEDGVSSNSMDAELLQLKDRVNEQEEELHSAFDSALASEPAAAAPLKNMERKIEQQRKSIDLIMKEEVALPAVQMPEEMLDMPASSEAIGKSYAPKPTDIPMLSEQNRALKLDEKDDRQREFNRAELKQQRAEVAVDKAKRTKSITSSRPDQSLDAAIPSAAAGGLRQTPENWLTTINQLWLDGRTDDAVQQLQQFYEYNPDYQQNMIMRSLDPRLIDAAKIE